MGGEIAASAAIVAAAYSLPAAGQPTTERQHALQLGRYAVGFLSPGSSIRTRNVLAPVRASRPSSADGRHEGAAGQ